MVKLRTIGECAMQVGASHVGPEAERLFATLLLLATERGRRVSRSRLVALVWPTTDERNGRHCLRQTIYKLRQLGAPVAVTGGYVELPADAVESGLAGLLTSTDFDAGDIQVDAPFDEWLPGYVPSFSAPLQEWVEKQRDYVNAQMRRALVKAIIERRAQNRWADVDALARRCLVLDPLNEEATLALAESAAMTGSKTTALRILDAYLAELGPRAGEIAMPAEVLRRRIAERLKQPRYVDPSEAYFVGRAAVMAAFASDLQAARGTSGSAHLVWGPSGIGKSRLTIEVAKLAALQGLRIHRATCQSTDVGRPLSVFADAIPALRRLPGAAGVDPKSVKYLMRLSEYDEALAEPPEDPYESAVLFANVRRSIFDLFDAVTTECSLLFVVDDAHWLDAMSWSVLRELMEGARAHRLLILCTSRAPHATPTPPTEATRGLRVQRLAALDAAACDELIDAVTRDASRGRPDARLREWTLTVAEGNPLFVRALIGHWMNGYPEYTLPPSLEALIEERLDRLTPTALRVLQACAVLGKNSKTERIEEVVQLPESELLIAVGCLEREGAISSSGHPSLPCKHEVIAHAATSRLGSAALSYLRLLCARVLERELLDRVDVGLLWECVNLWLSVNEPKKALADAREIASYLANIGLLSEAWAIYERMLSMFELTDVHAELRVDLYTCARRFWDWPTALRVAHEIRLNDGNRANDERARLDLEILEMRWHLEDDPDAIRAECDVLLDSNTLTAQALICVAHIAVRHAHNLCDPRLSSRAYSRVRPLFGHPMIDRGTALEVEVVFQAGYGDIGSAIDACSKLVELRRREGDAAALASALRYAAQVFRIAGDLESARSVAVEAREALARQHNARQDVLCLAQLIEIAIVAERYQEATDWCDVSDAIAQTIPDALYRTRTREWRARVLAAAGDPMAARSLWNPDYESLQLDPFPLRRATKGAYWICTRTADERAQLGPDALRSAVSLPEAARQNSGCDAFVLRQLSRVQSSFSSASGHG